MAFKLNDENSRSRCAKLHRRQAVSKEKALCKRKKVPWKGRQQTARLAVPFAFNIYGNKNRLTVLKFFKSLREITLERRMRCVLDFTDADVIGASTMLLFVAELDRIKRIIGSAFSVGIENVKNRRVNQVLCQVGVYALCDIKRTVDEDEFDDNVRHWRYATGERANEQTSKAFENVEGRLSPQLAKGMWKSVSEAVVNSVQHAYAAPRGVNGDRMRHARWWMFSQEKDGELTVVVCDLGIGIPRSLPLNWKPSVLDRLLARMTGEGGDVKAIRAALEVGNSSTGDTHRGKGLPQIWNTLRREPSASIAIISNHGQLTWNGETQKEFAFEYSYSIAGTIISWTVKVEAAVDEG